MKDQKTREESYAYTEKFEREHPINAKNHLVGMVQVDPTTGHTESFDEWLARLEKEIPEGLEAVKKLSCLGHLEHKYKYQYCLYASVYIRILVKLDDPRIFNSECYRVKQLQSSYTEQRKNNRKQNS